MITRLRPKDLKAYREAQWHKQNGICALCNEYINPTEAVLDHCHASGLIRQVLHRGCNALEGVITNNARRNLMTDNKLKNFLRNLYEYQRTAHSQTEHPTHRSPEEKAEQRKRRAQARRKARAAK